MPRTAASFRPHWPASASLVLFTLFAAAGAHAAPKKAAPPAPAVGVSASWRQQMPAADRSRFDRLCARIEAAYDTTKGYTAKSGMPSESAAEVALLNGLSEKDSYWAAHARRTVDWTLTLYDSAMSGFYNGASDAQVGSSSYSKRTDSNARRFEMLVNSWRLTGNEEHRRFAAGTYGYFERVLAEGRAGFVWGQVGDRQLYPEPNGLATHAYLHWAAVTRDPRPRDYALRSLDATWDLTWLPVGGFWKRSFLEELPKSVTLADQVAMGRAFVLAARVAGRKQDAERALVVGKLLLDWFADAEDGYFRSNATPKKSGGVKAGGRDALDNAHAVRFMAELSHMTGDPAWAQAGRRAVDAFEKDFDDMKFEAADWALAVRALSVSDLPERPQWAPVAGNASEPQVRQRSKRYRTGGGR